VTLLLLNWQPLDAAPQKVLRPPTAPIPPTLFGMHIHRAATTTPWPPIPFGTWRLWDTYSAWPNLEPEKGKWNFQLTDRYVELAEQHHVEVVFPVALSPTWASARQEEKSGYGPGNAAEPRDLNDWRNYVLTIATRYKGRVRTYEIWNEPNLKSFYSGSVTQLVQLASVAYQTLKEVDPTITVCSPAFTGAGGVSMFEEYLKAGGRKYADVIGYHLYVNPDPPEEMVPLIQQVKEAMVRTGAANKPLWNTESGWAIQNAQSVVEPAPGKGYNSVVLPQDGAASYLARAYVLSWASGVSRFYWYSWDHGVMGLVDHDAKTLKSPAIAYGEIGKWLVGAVMLSCKSNTDGTWVAEVSRQVNYHGWIVWNPNTRRTFNFPIPPEWNVIQIRDLLGHVSALAPGASIEVSVMPHLLETK